MKKLLNPLISSILCGCVLLGASQVATAATSAHNIKATQKISFLSTLLAKTGDIQKTTHGYRLILMNLDPRMLWFSDRPKRLAGFTSTKSVIKNWDTYFKSSNPNAAVVYVKLTSRMGFVEKPIAIEISNPLLIGGNTLIFNAKPLSNNFSVGVIKLPVLFLDGISPAAIASPALMVDASAIATSADLNDGAADANQAMLSEISQSVATDSTSNANMNTNTTNPAVTSYEKAQTKKSVSAKVKHYAAKGINQVISPTKGNDEEAELGDKIKEGIVNSEDSNSAQVGGSSVNDIVAPNALNSVGDAADDILEDA